MATADDEEIRDEEIEGESFDAVIETVGDDAEIGDAPQGSGVRRWVCVRARLESGRSQTCIRSAKPRRQWDL